ncbi:SWPV1-288 [Shearwaterpox virus]|uniref:SWPV1-288 n=1 Tax=Shearwaterpox virus TaxID=1974596 RepID=A0A1V0S8A8_CNPV|nr:SWPV1-288 [Shearwaterpox virus]
MGNLLSLYTDFMRVLISLMKNPQCEINKNTMLNASINRQYTSVVEYLIRKGADVKNPIMQKMFDISYPSPLVVASKIGNEEIAKILILHGAGVNKKCEISGYTPLHVAVTYGNIKVVKLLLENGANPNSFDNEQLTPLHIAINKHPNMIDLIKLLLKHGADVHYQDGEGISPLSLCFKKEFPSATKDLIVSYFLI